CGVERLAEVHDVDSALAQSGSDRRAEIGGARGHLELDIARDFLCHVSLSFVGLRETSRRPDQVERSKRRARRRVSRRFSTANALEARALSAIPPAREGGEGPIRIDADKKSPAEAGLFLRYRCWFSARCRRHKAMPTFSVSL